MSAAVTITLSTEAAAALRDLADVHRAELPPNLALTIRAELVRATILGSAQ